jgi:hypothetical protein
MRSLFILIAPVLAIAMLSGARAMQEGSPADTPVIRITGEGRPKIPIAIPPIDVASSNGALGDAADAIRRVVQNDLEFSGYFFIVPEEYHNLISPWSDRRGNYKEWLGIGAESLLVTKARNDGGKEMVFEGRVFDTTERRMVLGKRYRGNLDMQRVIAHRMSNEIIQQYTGRQGVSLTRIAFVSEVSRGKAKEVHVMDYDGSRVKRITANGSLNISPSWSPDGKQIAFVSYRSGTLLVARRPVARLLQQPRRERRDLRDAGLQSEADPPDTAHRDRHVPDLVAERTGDRLHLRSERAAADLRDGRRGGERPPHHLRRVVLRRALLVAERADRLHRPGAGRVRYLRQGPRLGGAEPAHP